ncbi:hypothetical protein ABMA28_004824 [Loxostege sticticalis]|uniref:DUF7869 domain-containing protein n=1 Tax=Loxostege sticticalis TaxID=481309 RepID=A0ABD0STI4_LOXSC
MGFHFSILICISAKTTALLDEEQQCDFQSPLAPTYSPLTPLVATKKATSKIDASDCEHRERERNSSPLRQMSPLTFEIYQTLSESFLENGTETSIANNDVSEMEPEQLTETLRQKTHSKELHDLASDSDNDPNFIPNSEEDSSDQENLVRSRKIKVVAVAHNKTEKEMNTSLIPDADANDLCELTTCANDSINDETTQTSNESESLLSTNECLDSVTSAGRPKKGRKRKYQDYTLRERKQRKYENLPYQGKTKYVNSLVFRDYTCSCSKKCHQLISKEKREVEFQRYETPKKRSYTVVHGNKSGNKKPKEFTRTYKIANVEVCRNMFVNNFQITPKKVDISLRKFRRDKCINDERGQSVGGWNKTQEEDVKFVKDFIDSLPKYESHYRRDQNSGCQYLKLGMTNQKLYELYLEKHKEVYEAAKAPVSFNTLKKIFFTNFNLRCKSLKKDTCSRCDAFNNKIKNCTDEGQEKLKEERLKHLKRAEDLRENMKKDLLKAKTDENFECLTFDLEKTLPLPRIPTSIVFYKRQLWLYNCGIHAGSDESAHCYVWIEGEAGRGAQEVGSCLIKYIKNKLNSKVQHLVLWSDCCGGQNRNIKIVLMLKAILNQHQSLKTITLKYLESGHTFLPNDTDFSKIETQLKYHERIYTADEYISVIKRSKKKNPIQVQRMGKEDFFSTKKIEKNIVNRKICVNKVKVNWLQTKEILLKKEYMHTIFMKTQNEEHQELNIEKKIKGKSLELTQDDFTLLWPNGKEIPQAKLDDLKSLFEFIPKDCLDFYNSLQGNSTLQDDIDGFGGEPDFNIENQEQEEN